MAEDIVHEKIEPTMKSIDERLSILERKIEMGKEKIEKFAQEKPIMALGVTLLVGTCLGFLLGTATARARD